MFRQKTARSEGFSRVELVVTMVMAVIIVGLMTSCVQKVRNGPGGARTQTNNNLKQLTLACHGVNDVYKKLPPAFDKFGPMKFPASVHIHLFPYVEQDLYKLYLEKEGKGDATNAVIPPFLSPQDSTVKNDGAGVQNFAANLRVFSHKGLKTAFDSDMPPMASIEPGTASIPSSIPDGMSNTMAFAVKFAECGGGGSRYAAAPDSNFAAFFGQNAALVPASPSDVTATFQLAPGKDDCHATPLLAQSFNTKGISVSLFDGSVRFINPSLSARTWNLLVQPNDKMKLGADWDEYR